MCTRNLELRRIKIFSTVFIFHHYDYQNILSVEIQSVLPLIQFFPTDRILTEKNRLIKYSLFDAVSQYPINFASKNL